MSGLIEREPLRRETPPPCVGEEPAAVIMMTLGALIRSVYVVCCENMMRSVWCSETRGSHKAPRAAAAAQSSCRAAGAAFGAHKHRFTWEGLRAFPRGMT